MESSSFGGFNFFCKKVEIGMSVRLCGNRGCGVLFWWKSRCSVLFDDESGVVRGFPMPVPGWGCGKRLVFSLVIVWRDSIRQGDYGRCGFRALGFTIAAIAALVQRIKRGNYVSPFGILFLEGFNFFCKKVEIEISIRLCGNRGCGVLFWWKSPCSVLFSNESGKLGDSSCPFLDGDLGED